MIKHILPKSARHGTFFRLNGPCKKILGGPREIVLENNEQCSFILLWSEKEKRFIWMPYERCAKYG